MKMSATVAGGTASITHTAFQMMARGGMGASCPEGEEETILGVLRGELVGVGPKGEIEYFGLRIGEPVPGVR